MKISRQDIIKSEIILLLIYQSQTEKRKYIYNKNFAENYFKFLNTQLRLFV